MPFDSDLWQQIEQETPQDSVEESRYDDDLWIQLNVPKKPITSPLLQKFKNYLFGTEITAKDEVEESLTTPEKQRTSKQQNLISSLKTQKLNPINPNPMMAIPSPERPNSGEIRPDNMPPIKQPGDYPTIDLIAPYQFLGGDLTKHIVRGTRAITKFMIDDWNKRTKRIKELETKADLGNELNEKERTEIADFYGDAALTIIPGAGIVKGVIKPLKSEISSNFWEKIKKLIVPRYKQPQEYISLDMERAGTIALQQLQTKKVLKSVDNLSFKDRQIFGEALKKRTVAPEHMKKTVETVRKEIDTLSDSLSKELDPETHKQLIDIIQNNIGVYSRRLYARDILGKDYVPQDEVVQEARDFLFKEMAIFDDKIGSLRPATVDEIDSTILQILDTGKVSVFGKTGKKININPLMKRKDIPLPIRRLMGEITDGNYIAARTMMDLQSTLQTTRFFNKIAKNSDWTSNVPQPGFTATPMGNNPRLGPLKGKYVLQSIAEDINEMTNTSRSTFEKVYMSWLSSWKFSKTVLNPATHGRNVLGNIIFSDLAGNNMLNPLNAKWYAKAAKEILNEGATFEEAVKSGAIGTEFVTAELKPTLQEFIRRQGGVAEKLNHFGTKFVSKAAYWYNFEDQITKLSTYMKQRSKHGQSIEKATRHVNTWFPNYRDVAPVIKKARQTPIGTLVSSPFITFSAETIRIYGNAAKSPRGAVKLFKWGVAFPAGITAFSAYNQNLTLEDVGNVYNAMPEKKRKRYSVLLPWRDKDGSLQTADFSYILPLGDALQGRGLTQTPLISQFIGGHPLPLAAAQIAADENFFTGGPIARPSDVNEILTKAIFGAEQLLPVPSFALSLKRDLAKPDGPKKETIAQKGERLFSPLKSDPLDVQVSFRKNELKKERTRLKKDFRKLEFELERNPELRKSIQIKMERLETKLDKVEIEFDKLEKGSRKIRGVRDF